MSDVHVKKSSVDLKTGHEGDTIVGAVVEVCRLDNRVTGEQPLGLCMRVLADLGLLQQGISYIAAVPRLRAEANGRFAPVDKSR